MWAYVKLSLSRIKGGDKKLLAHTPAHVDVSVDRDLKTPALLAAARADCLVLRVLVQAGADLTRTTVYCKVSPPPLASFFSTSLVPGHVILYRSATTGPLS